MTNTELIKKNILLIHECLKENIREVVYKLEYPKVKESETSFNYFYKTIDFEKPLSDILKEYNYKEDNNIFSIRKNGFIVSLNIDNKSKFIYILEKIQPAIGVKSNLIILSENLDYKKINSLKEFISFSLDLINKQVQEKHPDELTSIILDKLALPQNHIPFNMNLKMSEYNLNRISSGQESHVWHDMEGFELTVFVNNYSVSIVTNDEIEIYDNDNDEYEKFDSIPDFLRDKGLENEIFNDYDLNELIFNVDTSKYSLNSTNSYLINAYEYLNERYYRYDDDDIVEISYELDNLSELLALAVETLNKIINLDYNYDLLN